MADQNITELPVKTSSGMTSSDYMLGIDSAEGYQMLIKDLGDYIIRNVQVNTIAGANQTLKSALDTLNSNIDTKDAAPKTIDANSLGNGIHTHSSTSTNIPVSGMGGTILSLRNNYNSQGAQLAQANTKDGFYYRNLINSTWGNWAKLPTRDEFDTLNSKTITAITPSSIPEGITLTRCDEMHVGNLTILELTMRNGDSGIENVRKTFGFNKKYGRILAMTFFGNANTSDTGYTVSLNIPTFSTYAAGTNTTNITFDFGYTDGHPMAYTNNRIHVAHCLLVFADVS